MKKTELRKIIKEELLKEASRSEIAKWQTISENTYRALSEMKKFVSGKRSELFDLVGALNSKAKELEDLILDVDKALRERNQ